MSAQAFEKLQVLVTGVEAAIARDVASLIVSESVGVLAADADAGPLVRLQRDLGRHGSPIETAQVDLASPTAVRLWAGSLSALGRLPRLMICCCAAGAGRRSRARNCRPRAQLPDVALGEHEGGQCPARLAGRVLQPALFLHAQPLRLAVFDRALAVIRYPTLRGVLAVGASSGALDSAGSVPPFTSTANSTRRHLDGETMRGGRLRLVPPSDRPPGRADAA